MTFNAHNNILLFWREILESADYTCEFSSEENITDARARKEIKYTPLRDQIQDNNWTCHLRTIEVGARGFVSSSVPRCLRQLGFSHSKSKELSRKVSIAAARCSFAIYKCFKVRKWEWFSPVKIDWNLFHLNADHSTLLLCNMGSTFSSPDISIDAVIWLTGSLFLLMCLFSVEPRSWIISWC